MAVTRQQAKALAELGRRVRVRRLKLGYTQERLAEVASIHTTYLSSIERGQRNIGVLNLIYLARALETDPGSLVRGLKA